MENYAVLSIETHLFFARIMREHALFLEAGFPGKEKEWIEKADWFRAQFEELLRDVMRIANGRVNRCFLESGEMVTEFTTEAEKRTECLSGIPIDCNLSIQARKLKPVCACEDFRRLHPFVHELNERARKLLNGLIEFKECILKELGEGDLYNANYPLLIKHILREAKLYRASVEELMQNRMPSYRKLAETEKFWNRIMMEHAQFIRGLLDPCEEKLIDTADDFAKDYCALLKAAKDQDCLLAELRQKSLETTLKYREFKEAGTKGILNCRISSIILPLLADHVLREANHYIRLLE